MSTQPPGPVVEDAIQGSLPFSRRAKHFLDKKYLWLVEHNGELFAANVFKECKEVVMAYVSDPDRKRRISHYMGQLPIRNRLIKRSIFVLADCQPHIAVDLFKRSTLSGEPLVTVEQSGDDLHDRLDSPEPAPKFLEVLGRWARSHHYNEQDLLRASRADRRWRLRVSSEVQRTNVDSTSFIWPTPSDYRTEDALVTDMTVFIQLVQWYDLEGVEDSLGDEPYLSALLDSLRSSYYDDDELESGIAVGRVHHIPKKGTYKRRPIADPNKFMQSLSTPFAQALYRVLRKLSQTDCTFNQNKFVALVRQRIDRGEYVGSVDLSAATDYLPIDWFPYDWDSSCDDMMSLSREAALILASGEYLDDGGGVAAWTRGQPLGSRASFAILGITHNYVLDLISRLLGIEERSYVVLGDDVLIFDKTLRQAYIEIMTMSGCPLSLHKSYDVRAVEFAGRFFVKNQIPWYTSDQKPIYYSNLFDYQLATGVYVDWHRLSVATRKQWSHGFASDRQAEQAYKFVYCAMTGRHIESLDSDRLARFYEYLVSDETLNPDAETRVWHDLNGHPFLFVTGVRKTRPELQSWKRNKFRPYSTTTYRNAIQRAWSDSARKVEP